MKPAHGGTSKLHHKPAQTSRPRMAVVHLEFVSCLVGSSVESRSHCKVISRTSIFSRKECASFKINLKKLALFGKISALFLTNIKYNDRELCMLETDLTLCFIPSLQYTWCLYGCIVYVLITRKGKNALTKNRVFLPICKTSPQ